MNYLTNYYKNLSEQLQEQVNQLENLILEYRKTKTQRVDVHDVENTGEDAPMLHGRVVTKMGNPAGKGAAKERSVSFYPSDAFKTIKNYPYQESDAWETIANWGRPSVENNPIYANLRGKGPALEVDSREIVTGQERGIRGKGGSEKGKGKKAAKKREAMRKAGQQNESMTYLQRLLDDLDQE